MKILVTAVALSLTRTSEGICTSKFLYALSRAGHVVVCLTSEMDYKDYENPFCLSHLGSIRVYHINKWKGKGIWPSINRFLDNISKVNKAFSYIVRKLNALIAYSTGYNASVWQRVAQWEESLEEITDREKPDLIFVRAAGAEFEPHFAMLNLRRSVPWIANYHDPFPISLYPEPYKTIIPFISFHQEALHKKILGRADALTFPSRRLLDWVLSGQLSSHKKKAFVVPHLAMDLPDEQAEKPKTMSLNYNGFMVVHAGTLLSIRKPWALLEGFREFIGNDVHKKEKAQLVFIGKVHREITEDEKWSCGDYPENIVLINERFSYFQTLEILRNSAAAVILEAENSESPFSPAKLADILWLRKPVLALSPGESAVADLLGDDYPLLVSPKDSKGIKNALELLWKYWNEGKINEFIMPLHGMSEFDVMTILHLKFQELLANRGLQSPDSAEK